MQRRVRGRRLGAWGALAVCMVPAAAGVGVSSGKVRTYVRTCAMRRARSSRETLGPRSNRLGSLNLRRYFVRFGSVGVSYRTMCYVVCGNVYFVKSAVQQPTVQ